jgi:uncharacterized SAM-binding protein YcdF (DUF218 family)
MIPLDRPAKFQTGMKLPRIRTLSVLGISLIAASTCLWWVGPVLLRGIGGVLIRQDSLKPAAAIVVLGGGTPFREIQGGKIYAAGWAPYVMVVQSELREEGRKLRELQIPVQQSWELSRDVLERVGVPSTSIHIGSGGSNGTLTELRIAYRAIDPGQAPVILVTSQYHALRARLIWRHITQGRSEAIVRTATDDPFDVNRWWKEPQFALSVVREYLGLFNFWAGFPVSSGPRR